MDRRPRPGEEVLLPADSEGRVDRVTVTPKPLNGDRVEVRFPRSGAKLIVPVKLLSLPD